MVQIPNYILGVAAGIFITRILGPEGKGVYAYFTANTQLLVMFFGFNINGGLNYFVSNKEIAGDKLSGFSLLLVLVSAILGSVILLIPLPFNSVFYIDGYDTIFYRLFLYFSFLLSIINSIFIGFLHGNKKFSAVNFVTLINAILNFIVFIVLFFLFHNGILTIGIEEVFISLLCIQVINTFIYFYYFKKYAWEGITVFPFCKESFKKLLYFLIPSFLSIFINFFNYRLLIWVINYYESNDQLGFFSLALNFSQMVLTITMAINTVMFPHFSSLKDIKKAKEDFILVFKVNTYLIAGVSIFMYFLSSWLIPAFYGSEFIPSIRPFKILLTGTFFLSLSQVFGHFFGAMNKNWLNSLFYAIVLLVLGTLGILLTPKHGITGASWANSIAYFILFILFAIMVGIKFNIPFHQLFYIHKTDIQKIKALVGKNFKKS